MTMLEADPEKIDDEKEVHIGRAEEDALEENATDSKTRGSNQLTLLFQGEVYVFDSVTPDKVQAVLLLLGGCEMPTSITSMPLSSHPDNRGLDDILCRSNIPAKRVASLIRFREKRKERCFDKKIRYTVRKEVALRMQRRKGQFAGKANLDDGHTSSFSTNPTQNSSQGDASQEAKCQNCGIGEKATPAMRRGPAGPRSLCNACGLMWANKGTLRSPTKTLKVWIQGPTNQNEQGSELTDSDFGDKKLPLSFNDHEAVCRTDVVGRNGTQSCASKEEEMGEEINPSI